MREDPELYSKRKGTWCWLETGKGCLRFECFTVFKVFGILLILLIGYEHLRLAHNWILDCYSLNLYLQVVRERTLCHSPLPRSYLALDVELWIYIIIKGSKPIKKMLMMEDMEDMEVFPSRSYVHLQKEAMKHFSEKTRITKLEFFE